MQEQYFVKIKKQLACNNNVIFPKKEDVFNAFNFFDVEDTKVVILGQDPYFNENQAHGLAFSVQNNNIPKSLLNIFKELKNDLGINRINGNLSNWAEQGILLLNTILTVDKGHALSHKNYGWQTFTKQVIELIDKRCENVVFVLWGNDAKKYQTLIKNSNHLILTSSHPSPLSAHYGFFGSKPFSKINNFFSEKNMKIINW